MALSEQDHSTQHDDIRHTLTAAINLPGIEEFSSWLDEELEQLEERHRAFWTRRSVVGVLLAICQSR